MKIAVLGAGVIGTTTAYYLARDGHEVEVIDRRHGPALETSFANAGEVSPGYASPWAAPGIPLKALKWLFMRHAPLRFTPTADPHQYRWMLQMLANCTDSRYAVNKGRMVRLAEYSRDVLATLRAETGITYDDRAQGTLQLFRTTKQLDHAADDVAVLKQYDVRFEELDRAGCVAAEPGLAAARDKIAGGLRLPGDETGDCFLFTNRLADMARAMGVRFTFDTDVLALEKDGDAIAGIRTRGDVIHADHYVLALGSYSRHLAKSLDLELPVYPVKGYSITLPIVDTRKAPVSTVMDETYKVAITRLGDRIRVGGMAELSGYNDRLPQARQETLLHSVTDLYAGAADTSQTNFWTGLRPMTPDSTPIVGASRYRNLFLNTGHGTLGWTMSCGSAKITADMIAKRVPDIATEDLGLTRYESARPRRGGRIHPAPPTTITNRLVGRGYSARDE